MFVPSNNFAKMAIGAEHLLRVELSDQLFFPIAVDIHIPSQPMRGGSIGNRAGESRLLTDNGVAGNTAGFAADFSNLEGDPVTVVRAKTSDGVAFFVNKYDNSGQVTIEDSRRLTAAPYGGVPRYVIKADGKIYDCLEIRGGDNLANGNGPYQHWEFAVANNGAGYTGASNTYNPGGLPNGTGNVQAQYLNDINAEYAKAGINPAGINVFAPNSLTPAHYVRPVGFISFRAKQGASSGAIQEQLTRAQSTIDTLSRILRSLHDEAKGPFANIVVR